MLEPEECPAEYEPLLYRVWNGTYDVCERLNELGAIQYNIELNDKDGCSDGVLREGSPPINMTNIAGFTACGKRGGPNFIDTMRVE